PELTNTIPPATTGPGPSIEPPLAGTPLTVSYFCTVSTSQTIAPLSLLYARRWPSSPPDRTMPGMAVTAADWAGLHPGLSPQPGCGALQTISPFAGLIAKSPPPARGFRRSAPPPSPLGCAPGDPAGAASG